MLSTKFIFPSSDLYKKANPYPNILLKDMWDENFLTDIADTFPSFKNWDGEKTFYGAKSKRFCYSLEKLPKNILNFINYLNSSEFLSKLENLTGEKELIPDPKFQGAGMTSIKKGGFLKMHADFMWHGELNLYRRLNVLIYLNKNWDEKWGGDLRLASEKDGKLKIEKKIFPNFNSTVIFTTDDNSFHGHPDPMDSPDGIHRNSISTYYYVKEKPQGIEIAGRTSTDYRNLKGKKIVRDPFFKILLTDPKRIFRWIIRKIKKKVLD